MNADLPTLKAAVPLPGLVNETHDIDRTGKVLCPVHNDHTPSCHIYKDGWKCFACGAYGDVLDWLELTHNLSTAEAIKELERRVGGYVPPVSERQKVSRPPPTFKPVPPGVLAQHHRRAAQLDRVPAALQRRGFTVDDLQRLQIAAYGPDAVIPIPGSDGAVLALKRRYAKPYQGKRYRYTTPGHGTPPWCSLNFSEHERVLVIEGELNGAACWLACPELSVMGTAGTNGALHLEALKGRTVYVYADGDDVGQAARDRWAKQVQGAGAQETYALNSWPVDACDLAGQESRAALREQLTRSLEAATSFVHIFNKHSVFDEQPCSSNKSPWLSQKSHLTNMSRTQIGTEWTTAKNPWGN